MYTRDTLSEKNREKDRKEFLSGIENYKLVDDFPMFINRQDLIRYLIRYELFKMVLDIKGSIVECGVYKGASLMLYAQLSAIFESYAFTREIIGFDAFGKGFPHIDDKKDGHNASVGYLSDGDMDILKKCIKLYDENRPIGHIPKVKLIDGDAVKTIPKFFRENPHAIVSLLYLDFDLYTATKVALETILPRMPKASIIAFDELNCKNWPGETLALLESCSAFS